MENSGVLIENTRRLNGELSEELMRNSRNPSELRGLRPCTHLGWLRVELRGHLASDRNYTA